MTQGLWVSSTEVRLDKKHGKTVEFAFYGQDEREEEEAQSMYESEAAFVNIRRYLDNLVLIRNVMYGKIKKFKKAEKTGRNNERAKNRRIKVKD